MVGLNKVKQGSNMYLFNDTADNEIYTWNVIKGKCSHSCSYCFMRRFPQSELHFDEAELRTDLGSGNTIFVGSSCDMWAEKISRQQILAILNHCAEYNNHYLFQTKNPMRFHQGFPFPPDTILGTTIESNRCCCDWAPGAPCAGERYLAMKEIILPKMVSLEPIMEFDLEVMLRWMQDIKPEFVSIGADSRGCYLPEPSAEKVKALIAGLKEFTEVRAKANLNRLLVSTSCIVAKL